MGRTPRGEMTERLRAAILAGRFRPGGRLVEATLAHEFGISRIPVREALRVLAGEGLVELRPRRGAVVAPLSHRTACEIIEVRAALEGLNARLAARRRDPMLIEEMQALLGAGGAAAIAGDARELSRHNRRFHELLGAAVGNDVLSGTMRALRERTARVLDPTDAVAALRCWREHEAIMRAVIAGDHEMAELLAVRHVCRAAERFLRDTECASCARSFSGAARPACCPPVATPRSTA